MKMDRILRNPYRVMILKAIGKNGATFSEIRDKTGLSTGTIYHHLNVMKDLIYKEGKIYKLTKKGQKILGTILSGELIYEPTKITINDIIRILLLRDTFRYLYASKLGKIISILFIAITILLTYTYHTGFIILKPIRIQAPFSTIYTLISFSIIPLTYLVFVWLSVEIPFKLKEIMNMIIIQFIPLSILDIIIFLIFFLHLNISIVNSLLQFISALYLSSAISSVSGLSFDRALAISGILLFISQLI